MPAHQRSSWKQETCSKASGGKCTLQKMCKEKKIYLVDNTNKINA